MADSPAERAQTFAQQAFPTYEIVETVDFEQDPSGIGDLHEYNVVLQLAETDGTEEKTVELFVVDESEASYLDGTGYTVSDMEVLEETDAAEDETEPEPTDEAASPMEKARQFAEQSFPAYDVTETLEFEQDPSGVGDLYEYKIVLRLAETDGDEEKSVELFVVDESAASFLDGTGYTVNEMEPIDE